MVPNTQPHELENRSWDLNKKERWEAKHAHNISKRRTSRPYEIHAGHYMEKRAFFFHHHHDSIFLLLLIQKKKKKLFLLT